ncbi:MAG: Nif3-like dinuclear metal center hexameric protein [Flavobacteriales bacterium]|nr:Nif3-like dinuclear metal center hexameric protein [Flavobacteriales bacterium]
MKVKDITTIIENFAPLSYQESYDNSGLIVGNTNDEVTGVLICLDCVEAILDEAIANNCNMVIAHHPIVFSGLKQLNGKNYIERIVIKAIKNGIAIYAAHTNLDNVQNGVSFKIAQKIGVKNCQVLLPKKSLLSKVITYCPIDKAEEVRQVMFNSGAGNIGNYSDCSYNVEGVGTFRGKEGANPYVGKIDGFHQEKEIRIETVVPTYKVNTVIESMIAAHPYEEVAYDVYELVNTLHTVGSGVIGELSVEENESDFLKRLKTDLKTDCIRHTNLLGKKIKKVAICGGSGSFLLNDAIAAGADIFITGDFKYHQFFDADNNIIIADVGHYESEQYTSELIYEILNEKIPNFAVRLTEKSTNPVNYL